MGERPDSPPDADAELMLRLQAGDETAFAALFSKYSGVLLGFVDRFFHNRAESEDVVQEVFLRVYRARAGYQPKSKFSTWLYTIATRASFNHLRGGKPRAAETAVDELPAADHGTPGADAVLEGKRLQDLVGGVLGRLPENQRAALLLTRFGGRSYSEAAEILQCTEAAVKSLVFRATDEVRRGIEAYQAGLSPSRPEGGGKT